MSVPVSQYEALRNEMRNLVHNAQQLQEIASDVITATSSKSVMEQQQQAESSKMSLSSDPITIQASKNALLHGTWPIEKNLGEITNAKFADLMPYDNQQQIMMDQGSVLSFASSSGAAFESVLENSERLSRRSMQQLEAKVDMVYSLLAMLGGQEHANMGDTLLALSTSAESCLAMRQSGCIPLLVQLVQSDKDQETRKKAAIALNNLVQAQPDERQRKREMRVLKLLETTREYVDSLTNHTPFVLLQGSSGGESDASSQTSDGDNHPVSVVANLMKHSFDEGHRHTMCQLGGAQIIASAIEVEHGQHGNTDLTQNCILLRRYACMALTNLTFGDSGIKALLCSLKDFMRALVVQLQSSSDELRQVTASVLRNLSWRADQSSKDILREVGTVHGLMKAGMATSKENTLKSILSALWNLSAHCAENKLEICAIDGGLGFLVDMLCYKAPSKSLKINENAGGILRNVSSYIAVREDYREMLRAHNCLQILLVQLKSPSLTIVSNACGTLWNLSAKSKVDQDALWKMGAPAMLRSLNHSKHKMIATGSSAALKNLLNCRPSAGVFNMVDSTARSMDLPALPTLGARKQKALMRDLDQNLDETSEQVLPTASSSASSSVDIDNDRCVSRQISQDERDRCSIEDCDQLDSKTSNSISSTTTTTESTIKYDANQQQLNNSSNADNTSSSANLLMRTSLSGNETRALKSSGIPLPKSFRSQKSLDGDAGSTNSLITSNNKFNDKPVGVATKHYYKSAQPQQLHQQQQQQQQQEQGGGGDEKSDLIAEEQAAGGRKGIDNRMLDPEAMIESLDRFTAELVSQASSHFQSSTTAITWNDDSATTITFSSLLEHAPQPISGEEEKAMSRSALLAMEATRIASVFKKEAENAPPSLCGSLTMLDKEVMPSAMNSTMNSAMNSLTGSDGGRPSPIMVRKNSLGTDLLLRRTFITQKSQGCGTDPNSDNSISNLDEINPPSILCHLPELEASLTGIQSLPLETHTLKQSIATATEPPSTVTNLEHIDPPSLFNDVTDLNNSLADVATENIDLTTDVFVDCDETMPPTECEVTEFSDANSSTPLASDFDGSSAENTPKRLTAKERRAISKDRFRTYVVRSDDVQQAMDESCADDYKTIACDSESFKTANAATTSSSSSTERQSKSPSKLGLSQRRRQFLQRRHDNADRFKTQIINDPSLQLQQSLSSNDVHTLLEAEANAVLRSLKQSAVVRHDELLDCETLSLVSNDDESESLIYRTYNKSAWAKSKSDIPIVSPGHNNKPKIVKPGPNIPVVARVNDEDGESKGIRGRRKPLYARSKLPSGGGGATRALSAGSKPTPTKQPVTPVTKTPSPAKKQQAAPLVNRTPTRRLGERQSTFTKDSPQPSSTAKLVSRIPSAPVTATKIPAVATTRPASSAIPKKTAPVSRIAQPISSSTKSTNVSAAATKKTTTVATTTTPQPQHQQQQQQAASKITSRIASLWKKVEENKMKQQIDNKNKVWIQRAEAAVGDVK